MKVENKNLLPVITSENDVYPYLKKINQFPILTDEEEKKLAIDWLEHGDTKAAQKLVTSHLRLVAKIAMGYKGYGLPLFDLISEGNLGLIQAIRKFDPDKGFRLATYAIWWIRASIQEYVLHSWSLVKIGTTAAQKKLFFNLRRLRNQLKKYEEGYLTNDQIKSISEDLGVTENEVKQMEGRVFNKDFSLNTPLNDENDSEWIDQVEDETINTAKKIEENDVLDKRKALYNQAVKKLEPRELEKLIKINNEVQLEQISAEFNSKLNILPIGNFSNLLIKDRGHLGLAVKLTGNFSKITANKDFLLVGAGVLDHFFSQYCYRNKISGYEFLHTIPGSIGGNIFMNAGCYGNEIKDKLISVIYYDIKRSKICEIRRQDINFDYRKGFQNPNTIILYGKFKIEIGDQAVIKNTMKENEFKRNLTQPQKVNCCGSIFKNPSNQNAWKLIKTSLDDSFYTGPIKLSLKHSNFFENDPNISADLIENFIKTIQKKVEEKHNITLEKELQII